MAAAVAPVVDFAKKLLRVVGFLRIFFIGFYVV